MFIYHYAIHDCPEHNESKDGVVHADDMNEAINQIMSVCPDGWTYYHISKEVN